MQEKTCLDCGEPVIGRSDKKFCSDQCRSNYYNKAHQEDSKKIRKINKILKRNHDILLAANPNGKTRIHKKHLTKQGFNFEYFTSIYTTKSGNIYYFCYNQGYLPIDHGYYALVERQDP